MNRNGLMVAAALAALCAMPAAPRAEMLAFLNYESMAEDSLDAIQLQAGPQARREGIAVMELDRASPDYGKIILDIPVPPDTMLHHIFYNKDQTKAYVTALGVPRVFNPSPVWSMTSVMTPPEVRFKTFRLPWPTT